MDARTLGFDSALPEAAHPPVILTSASNPLIKEIRRASRRGALTDDGFALAESPHLLEEAVRSGLTIAATLIAEGALANWEATAQRLHPDFHVVPDKLFYELSSTENSQGLISLVQLPSQSEESLLAAAKLVVVLDGIQDPGNAGSIVRSAEAFGASAVIFGRGTASPANPKTLRASAGSLFRVPFIKADSAAQVIAALSAAHLQLLAATAHEGSPISQIPPGSVALVIGSEGQGVSEEYLAVAMPVHIPVRGVESLNAAAAAAVLLYAAAERQTS